MQRRNSTPAAKRVGIIVHPTRMYCRRVILGITTVGSAAGWEWLLIPAEGVRALIEPSTASLHGVIGHLVDIPSRTQLLSSGIPVVDISSTSCASKAARVASDDVAVGRVAAAHLLSLGLAHYGFFGWHARDDSQLREVGFGRALAAAGFSCESFLWPAGDYGANGPEEPNGELDRWLTALPKPIGILASNDRRGLQLLAVCRRLGFAVPEAVSVLGVDNDEVFCELANPSLSSVALSTRQIGCEAARVLERLMHGETLEQDTLLIPPVGVVPRQSSGLKVIVDADVAAAIRYIAMHVKDDLQVADVLREVQVSRRSLDQRFLKVLGRTTAQEIGRVQVELAKQVLIETNESLVKVAAMTGFSNAKQMGATFQQSTGITPTAYRRQHRL